MTEDDSKIAPVQGPELIGELRTLIQAARTRVATAANAGLTNNIWGRCYLRCKPHHHSPHLIRENDNDPLTPNDVYRAQECVLSQWKI